MTESHPLSEGAQPQRMPQFREAIEFANKNSLNIIPLEHGRREYALPKGEFETKKTTKHSDDDLITWIRRGNDLGAVCGYNDLVVLDFDDPALFEKMRKDHPIIDTAPQINSKKGVHVYFFCPNLGGSKHFGQKGLKLDIIASGYIPLPGTLHYTGTCYYLFRNDIRTIPKIHLEELKEIIPQLTESGEIYDIDTLWDGAGQGNRDHSAFVLINHCVKKGMHQKEIEDKILEWGLKCKPPIMDAAGIKKLKEKIYRLYKHGPYKVKEKKEVEEDEENNKNPVDVLLDRVRATHTLFETDGAVVMIELKKKDHVEIHPVDSKAFISHLFQYGREVTGKTPSKQTVDTIKTILSHSGDIPFRNTFNRISNNSLGIIYDLTTKDWKGVHIDATGWRIAPLPPKFTRLQHQEKQCIPISGGSIKDIYEVINITDSKQRLLLEVYLVYLFSRCKTPPMLVLVGDQGSGKSVCLEVIKMLIDPSIISKQALKKDVKELQLTLTRHYFSAFDNIDFINSEVSSILCGAVTGAAYESRALYTNNEAVCFRLNPGIGMTGINAGNTKGDLTERSITIRLSRPDPEDRRSDDDLMDSFDEKKPYILGAIFDTLVRTLKKGPVKLKIKPRMANFAVWGERIAQELGYPPNEFIRTYMKVVEGQIEASIENDTVGGVVVAWLAERDFEWNGTPTELYDSLLFFRPDLRPGKTFPGGANKLSLRLNESTEGLRAKNIIYTNKKSNGVRRIWFSKMTDEEIRKNQAYNFKEEVIVIEDKNITLQEEVKEITLPGTTRGSAVFEGKNNPQNSGSYSSGSADSVGQVLPSEKTGAVPVNIASTSPGSAKKSKRDDKNGSFLPYNKVLEGSKKRERGGVYREKETSRPRPSNDTFLRILPVQAQEVQKIEGSYMDGKKEEKSSAPDTKPFGKSPEEVICYWKKGSIEYQIYQYICSVSEVTTDTLIILFNVGADQVMNTLAKLKEKGDIYEPRAELWKAA